MISSIYSIDNSILDFIKNNLHSFWLDKVMIVLTNLGDSGVIWIAIALGLIISKKYRKSGFMLLMAIILGALFGEVIIKNIVQRGRPFTHVPGMELLIKKPNSYSFPSGHTTASFAAAGILSYCFRTYSVAFYLLAALIAFSRLYLYVHYPSDVLGGIVLGSLSCLLTIYIFRKYINKQKNYKIKV
ncbi:phosphatase PAP2 family protein [Clostridium sp. YIM B02505]|uniref:Phosphatase PAP2 family protein n=2 Tax=Clostridium yunnanense TaxID=2800325 RepID=A0ABS1ESY4_9CLOT|nr:phosphatase PAP2 family protein [Clostridium yunnanense]MBK1812455.1 phosphatase PAP2 family protein [Clostridium yunnanense]